MLSTNNADQSHDNKDATKTAHGKILKSSKDEQKLIISVGKPTTIKYKDEDRRLKTTCQDEASRSVNKSPNDLSIGKLKSQANLKPKFEALKTEPQIKDFMSNKVEKSKEEGSTQSLIKNSFATPSIYQNEIIKKSENLPDHSQTTAHKSIDVSLNFQSNNLSKVSTSDIFNEDRKIFCPRPFKKNNYQNFMSNPVEVSISEQIEKRFENQIVLESPDAVFSDPPLESNFLFGNLPISVDKRDSSTYKIEALRKYLEDAIGLEIFLDIYTGIKDQNDEKQYPSESEKFLPFVHQLIFLEEDIFVCSH
jgi:hypothetical protein